MLARLDREDDRAQLKQHGILPFELICVNLYPFQETISAADVALEQAVENIDIGGPTLLRAAAKNHRHVVPVVDPADYDSIGRQLTAGGGKLMRPQGGGWLPKCLGILRPMTRLLPVISAI